MKKSAKTTVIHVGVIGYGGAFNMGKIHLNEAKRAGMVPVAVSDKDAARLKVAKTDFPGIKTYTSVSDMLKKSDVDLVIIITPHNTHAPLALQCINAGKHVVCEKPFTITTAESDAIISAAKKHKVVVSTYHNRHWDGCILNAVKVVKSGMLGDVVRVEARTGGWGNPGDWWRTSKTISGGILYDWGVHLLEYMLQIIRSDITEVSGFAKQGFWAKQTVWKNDTNEDEGFLAIRFKSGQWGTLRATSVDSIPKEGMLEITGTKGTLWYDYNTWRLVTHEGNESITRKGNNPKSEGYRFYQNVADHLKKGKPLIITPEWARRPIHVIDLACQSAKQGRALKPKYV
jgi:predicted dehydrogenase